MSLNRSTCSSPSVIRQMDEPERLMRSTDVQNASSYYFASESNDILAKEGEMMDARTHTVKNCDDGDATNVSEDMKAEDWESELDRKQAETTE